MKREVVPVDDSGWMMLRSAKFRRLVPFEFTAGKVRVEFNSLNGVTIDEVILTREPWVARRNRSTPKEVKK